MTSLKPVITNSESNYQAKSKNDEIKKSKPKKRVRLKRADIFGDNWLVDCPRNIIQEKTALGFDNPSPLLASLESFFDEVAVTSVSDREAAEKKAKSLMAMLIPKCTKLGRGIGLRFSRAVYPGSTMDGTQVLNATDVDVFMVFELPVKTRRVTTLQAGYKMIPLRKHNLKDKTKYDPWSFGRSADGLYLSPLVINKNVYNIVARALKSNRDVQLEPYRLQEGKSPICVKWEDHNIHITPALCLHSENIFLITRPYMLDEYVNSDMMWRMSFVLKERKLLNLITKTDRGMRKKAFIALKGLIAAEPTLHCLHSYQIKTILFHCFDRDIDSTPRWQRNIIETLFQDMLKELHLCLQIKNLPHFYVKDFNLLDSMDSKALYNVTQRLAFIINNPKELIRVLNKRPEQPQEEVLPFGSGSAESTDIEFSGIGQLDRHPGTEFTLLDSASARSDEMPSLSRSASCIRPKKRKEVTFAETATIYKHY